MEKEPNKTRYCVHHHNCDRDEDCMAGEQCDFEKRFAEEDRQLKFEGD